jgi:hypothetical protein
MKKIFILSLLSSISFLGCSVFNNDYGYINMAVKFPDKFKVMAIPSNTSVISVEVTGEGLVNPIKFDLSKNSNRKFLEKISIGNKNIIAIAKDDKGVILADGRNSIYVLAGRTNLVEVVLNPISIAPSSDQRPVQGGDSNSDTTQDQSGNDSDSSDSNSDQIQIQVIQKIVKILRIAKILKMEKMVLIQKMDLIMMVVHTIVVHIVIYMILIVMQLLVLILIL